MDASPYPDKPALFRARSRRDRCSRSTDAAGEAAQLPFHLLTPTNFSYSRSITYSVPNPATVFLRGPIAGVFFGHLQQILSILEADSSSGKTMAERIVPSE
jgi:hypothetical protein